MRVHACIQVLIVPLFCLLKMTPDERELARLAEEYRKLEHKKQKLDDEADGLFQQIVKLRAKEWSRAVDDEEREIFPKYKEKMDAVLRIQPQLSNMRRSMDAKQAQIGE